MDHVLGTCICIFEYFISPIKVVIKSLDRKSFHWHRISIYLEIQYCTIYMKPLHVSDTSPSMQNVCKTTFEVHDQAKFGFLLCKIFRGSWSTIFAETKNIQILKCNDLHFPCNQHACIGGRRTSWQLPSSLNNQHCRWTLHLTQKIIFSPVEMMKGGIMSRVTWWHSWQLWSVTRLSCFCCHDRGETEGGAALRRDQADRKVWTGFVSRLYCVL